MSFRFSQLMPNRLTFIENKKIIFCFSGKKSKWPPKLGVVFFGPPCRMLYTCVTLLLLFLLLQTHPKEVFVHLQNHALHKVFHGNHHPKEVFDKN